MSAGRVIHEDVQARDRRRREQIEAGRRTGELIDAAREYCRRYVPESLEHGHGGEPHAVIVGAAMALRLSLGRRPKPEEVIDRVKRRAPWVLSDEAA